MKEFIKVLLREGILAERLIDVDSDVNMIYDKYFKADVDKIGETGILEPKMFRRYQSDTSELRDPESIEAHQLNPCQIIINHGGNHYNPIRKVLSFSVNSSAFDFVIFDHDGSLSAAIKATSDSYTKNNLAQEFTEERIKGSIHHELAHWVDDTMHNEHINKSLKTAKELGTSPFKGKPVNSTKMEIEAQIHNIKQLHNKYGDIWDKLTFRQMLAASPALNTINKQLTPEIRVKWVRDLKTRMHREGLLGKNMVN